MRIIKNFLEICKSWPVAITTVSLILVIIWFYQGNILGTGESGLPFYNPQLQLDDFNTSWANYALGGPTNITIASEPSYWVLANLQAFGVPTFLMQAGFFLLILLISGAGIYLLTKLLFPNIENKFLIIAVLFYWFNPISVVNVWNRFLNNFFIFYLLIPVALFLFVKGIKSRSYFYSLLIGLISAIFSYAFTSIGFVILFWLIFVYTAMFYIYASNNLKERIFIIKFFLLTFILWCLNNLWWISQVFSYVYSGSFSSVEKTSFSSINNIQILSILSQRLGNLISILRFQHASFYSSENTLQWVRLYIFPLISNLAFLIPVVIFLPLVIKSRVKKVKYLQSTIFLSGLMIISIFFAKGNNPPFGEPINQIFSKVGFVQVFRNAFEKMGFLMCLAGTPLLALGLSTIYSYISRKWNKYFYSSILLFITIIYGFPLWTGLVFTSSEPPLDLLSVGYQVRVPDSYKQAASWLNEQKQDFRLLVLPLGGEGITYNWEKGYSGVELSNQLLPKTSVSFQTNIPFYDDISRDLEKIFLHKDNIRGILNILNAKYIMFRNDIDWKSRGMHDPQTIFNKLKEQEKLGRLRMVKDFGSISFWENPDWENKKVYLSKDLVAVSPHPKLSDLQFFSGQNNIVLTGDSVEIINATSDSAIIHPIAKLLLEGDLDNSLDGGQDIFPHVNYSPSSNLYKGILLKEQADLDAIKNISDKVNYVIMLLGKRLVEAQLAAKANDYEGLMIGINEYDKLLSRMQDVFEAYKTIQTDEDGQLINQEDFFKIFQKHKIIIQLLSNNFSSNQVIKGKLLDLEKNLKNILISEKIEPLYGFKKTLDFPIHGRVGYKFETHEASDYILLWGDVNFDKYYKLVDKKITLQIDSNLINVNDGNILYGYKSLGKVYFDQGIHEVSINTPQQVNLVDTPESVLLTVIHGQVSKIFKVKNYDPNASHTISFDYLIKKGTGFNLEAVSNNSKVNLGIIQPDYRDGVRPDTYNFEQKHFTNSFKLSRSADSADIIFSMKPWNDCEAIYFTKNKEICNDQVFRSRYDRTSEVLISNIVLTRKLVDQPVLLKLEKPSQGNIPGIDFNKINNTKYQVQIKNANSPYILVLSELFDAGWRLYDDKGQEIKSTHFIVNAYANGWKIDKEGDYALILKFAPEDLLNYTKIISKVSFIGGFIIVVFLYVRSKNVKSN